MYGGGVLTILLLALLFSFASCDNGNTSSPPKGDLDIGTPPTTSNPTLKLTPHSLRLEVGKTSNLTATVTPADTEIEWEASSALSSPKGEVTLAKNGTSCVVTGKTPGFIHVYSFPKGLDYLYGDSCLTAVTMKNTTKEIVGAWKTINTETSDERGFYYFMEDGKLYRLTKKEDGKFHYNSQVSGLWVQTAVAEDVYTFVLHQESTTESGSGSTSSSTFSPIKIKDNKDGTFQTATTTSTPRKIVKLQETELVDDNTVN